MADSDSADIFTEMLRMQSEAARQLVSASMPNEAALAEWGEAAQRLQAQWLEFHNQEKLPEPPVPFLADPAQWMGLMQAWYSQIPLLDPERQQQLWQEGCCVLGVVHQLGHVLNDDSGLTLDGGGVVVAQTTHQQWHHDGQGGGLHSLR